MPDITVSANVDSMMQAADNAAIRTAIGVPAIVGTTVDNAIVRNDGVAGAQQVSIVYVTDAGDLQLAGKTSSFPMIKRVGTAIEVRLADDSAYGNLTAFDITAAQDASVGRNLTVTALVVFSGIPTADPASPGQVWNDSGILKVSAG
jgi:hypothetical protein